MRSLPFLALLLAGMTACASGPLGRAGMLPGRSLPADAAVLVMAVADARPVGVSEAPNSGSSVSVATRRQLNAQGLDALADTAASLDEAFASARSLGCALVAQARILEWYDAQSDWVHGGDRVAVMLTLWSVDDELPLAWGADELEDQSMRSGREPPHRMVELLMSSIVAAMLQPGATVPPLEEV
jgi:hypothetical protein